MIGQILISIYICALKNSLLTFLLKICLLNISLVLAMHMYMYIYIVTYYNFYLKKAKSKFCFNKIHFEYFFINSIEKIKIEIENLP